MSLYTANLSATVTKSVTCESCGHPYEYAMSRTGSTPFTDEDTRDQESKEKIQERAAMDLVRQLDKDCNVVRCPQCGAITMQMKSEIWFRNGMGIVLIGMGCVIMYLIYKVSEWTHWLFYGIGLVGLAFVLTGLWHILCNIPNTLGFYRKDKPGGVANRGSF